MNGPVCNLTLAILKNSVSGLKVVITTIDKSKWIINPGDAGKAARWYKSQLLRVEETPDEIYKYRLVNLDTAGLDTVEANIM